MTSQLPATFIHGFHDEAAVRRMKYVPLGDTGLMVSQIGLGGTGFSPLFGYVSVIIRDGIWALLNFLFQTL